MSNKMLWKRLLATGMSIAMAATLFMTNSVATYAAEEEAGGDPNPVIAGDTEDSWAPEEPTDPEPVISSESKVIEETEDYIYVETTIKEDYYMSDVYSKDGEGNQTDQYKSVNAEETTNQTLDFTDSVVTSVTTEESIILKDEDDQIVTVPNEEGKEVPLELPLDYETEEVLIVKNNNGAIEEVSPDEAIYGYVDDDGNFVEDKDGEAYILTGNNDYVVAGIAYSTEINGEKVFLDAEMYKALHGEPSEIYTAEKHYDYVDKKGNESQYKSPADLKDAHKDVVSVDEENWKYTVNNGKNYTPVDNWYLQGVVKYDDAVIVSASNGLYLVDYYFKDGWGNTYVDRQLYSNIYAHYSVGQSIPHNPYGVITPGSRTLHVTDKTAEKTTVYITVYDKEGNPIRTFDKTAFDNLKAENITKVAGDKIAVEDKDGNRVLLDNAEYTEIFKEEKITNVTNVYYYTVQDKYEKEPIPLEFSVDDKDYELTVAFWQNNRIGATGVEVTDLHDGTVDVKVDFAYSSYKGDWEFDWFRYTWVYRYRPVTGTESQVFNVKMSEFGQDGKALLKIKYTPSYEAVVKSNSYPVVNVLRATGLASREVAGDLIMLELQENGVEFVEPVIVGSESREYYPEVAPTLPWWAGQYNYSVELGEPLYGVTKNDPEPQPNPNPNPTPDTTPSTPTTIDVTPVALAAAPGQVLGAQREETAADGAAVLGASRARGTADETTAPFVRVIIMAAVASAALFLTRKREEEN